MYYLVFGFFFCNGLSRSLYVLSVILVTDVNSQSAIGRAENSMYNGKSRHIRCRHNTIKQQLSTGVISIDYVKSKDNIADPLTKGLNREFVEKSSKGMGLKPVKE